MITRWTVLALCSASLMFGCVSQPSRKGDDNAGANVSLKSLDEDRYLIGHGSGDTPEVASDRARAEIAKIFKVDIQQTSSSTLDVQKKNGQESISSRALDDVQAKTRQSLSGIEIVDVRQDKASRRYQAVAVLEKAKAIAMLQQQMNTLAQGIEEQVRLSKHDAGRLGALKGYQEASALQAKHDDILQQLRVLRPGSVPASTYTLASLRQMQRTELSRYHFVARADVSWLQQALAARLGELGGHGSTSLIIEAALQRESLGERDGWLWERAALDLKVSQGNELVGHQQAKMKHSAPTQASLDGKLQSNTLAQLDALLSQTLHLIP